MTTAQAAAEAARLSADGTGSAQESFGTFDKYGEKTPYQIFTVWIGNESFHSIISFDECFDKIAQREVTG